MFDCFEGFFGEKMNEEERKRFVEHLKRDRRDMKELRVYLLEEGRDTIFVDSALVEIEKLLAEYE